MTDSEPVNVMIVFRLQPGCHEPWLELWRHLQGVARTMPGCHRFRLLCNRHDKDECIVLSEWDTSADFDAFARHVGLIWINRCLGRECEMPAYSIFSEIRDEDDLVTPPVERELALAGT